jgi:hypothetical protein
VVESGARPLCHAWCASLEEARRVIVGG